MKLSAGLLAVLVGCAAASQPHAEVFILPAIDTSSPPAITPSLARLLLLQRLASSGQEPSLQDVPNGVDSENAVSLLNRFGKSIPPLFSGAKTSRPSQLVLMLENMNKEQMGELRKALGMSPALTIADPPADTSHKDLVELDLYRVGALDGNKCSVQQVANPLENCWGGKHSAVARYRISEDPEVLQQLAKQLKQLVQLSKYGDLQTTIVALPGSKGSGKWTDEQQELRRRQAEQVISAINQTAKHPQTASSVKAEPVSYPSSGRVQSCYDSEAACNEATRNCTGHGSCMDKFASGGGGKAKDKVACFSCHCQATRSEKGSLTHWGGASCAKQDVSVPFWLFAGFTVAMIGIVSMSIRLLFNVGEEKLPGVIGAGVSRSK
ncbi:uncharacterized protein UV8b_01568 [Ustilaginoidea virens]|uniref:Vacuolar sorting protein Vps3844 C-terminal domain-containing protein n=1 Tax=Ustilaginoidea virens TaxID=1159556 RepID=A0A063C4W0_USTVR|nr:uncharacterized protein UV8b_01568 [Ustilaginoidea virens]QUC17327.1 hypothetical protein UV8b_01568 [Ustilaginoidea virens]GAO15707.1 hypothetical protein UVI_02018800 [Ustilaginoidea virens]